MSTNLLKQLTEKKKKLDQLKPLPSELLENLNEWLKIELTYTSNAIEGNTLTRQETALVVEKGLTIAGKTLNEHLEATNHAEAFKFILQQLSQKAPVTENMILDIHKIILDKINSTYAGRYRTTAVRIAGSTVILPNAVKVPHLMKEFVSWLTQKHKDHPVHIAAEAHFKLVTIHPFIDGNGRTARLLMNFLLLQAGYPPAVIRKEDRKAYLESLEKGQIQNDPISYYKLIYTAVDRSLDIYLEALEIKKSKIKKPPKKLLKIGELAKETNEMVHTIRFWTQEGLLQTKDQTQGGYALYEPEMIEKIKKIRKFQKEERLTIAEIKERLQNQS